MRSAKMFAIPACTGFSRCDDDSHPECGRLRGVEGVDAAGTLDGIEDVVITAKEGQTLVPLPEGASYLGFIFARGQLAETVTLALREAHAQLKFHLSKALPVVR